MERSEEFYQRRIGRITASRLPQILGLSGFGNRDSVLRAMVREYHGAEREFKGNQATAYGVENEVRAIHWYETMTGRITEPERFEIHPEHDWIAASPDAIDAVEDVPVEAKCPYNQIIPDEPDPAYVVQVKLQCVCHGSSYGYLVYWSEHVQRVFLITLEEGWFDTVFPAMLAFYEAYLEAIKTPDQYLQDRYEAREDADWTTAAFLWLETKDALEAAKQAENKAREELLRLSEHRNSIGHHVRVSWIERKGTVQWKRLQKKYEIPDAEVEEARGKPTTYAKVEEVKSD